MASLAHQYVDAIGAKLALLLAGEVTWVKLIATLFIIVLLYASYNTFLHPLRRYPGPLLWRSFRLSYVISTHRGRLHQDLKDFHTKYGPIVRIAPNELSYANSTAWNDIYASRPGHQPFQRNRTWFKKASPDEPHSIMGYDEDAHARFRRAFANSFSDKSLRDQAPVIESYVDAFMTQLRARSSGQRGKETALDLEKWFHYLTFDVSGDLSFGESFGCLKNGKAHPWVAIAQDFGKGLALIASINAYPPFDKLLRYIIPKRVIQRMKDHRDISAAKAQKRLALDTQRPDFVTPTKNHSESKAAISDAEWEINMAILVFAASETTSSALTAVVRELVQSGGVLHRLTQEIRSTFSAEKDIVIASTGGLPYLNAVINEALRLSPPVSISVPRTVPQGGDTICGQWVPGGTYVAVNQFPANRQAYNFRHPNSFIPERFLNPDPKTDNMSAFRPFLVGRHSCIGMKLAYAEMRVILARLLWAFDIALEDDEDRWDWGTQKIFVFWEKKPLRVVLRRAT
ncbi:cytochrome P450 [Dothidotthia symphoricarpi CBS 119687]|uniref:Cytochrome P450 n=1 Tax=Dothidotthia symphoricarpi CBS 119687 TaxID=1392245 RepID=A0A6A6AS68_9PLEO|nr:cytochrome P450 [Dothidotthia symphoricarpi CBS 119687]KAF2133687.1 cytochrome P450 [Dothidotthia symphoricarpi CBS 119687]